MTPTPKAKSRVAKRPVAKKGKKPPKMSKWRPAPPELVALFDRVHAQLPAAAERRKMFGYPCAFVTGRMFLGLHQENMVLRLSEPDRAEFLRLKEASLFMPMPGRVMKEYVVVPPSLKKNEAVLADWAKRSFAYALSLGPK